MKTPFRSSLPFANAPQGLVRSAVAAATLALAATLAQAAPTAPEEHVGIYAEKGDPARWRVPADTPQRRYDAETKGIRNALADALKDCRAMPADRAACSAEAQAQFSRDMDTARGLLARDRVSSRSPAASP